MQVDFHVSQTERGKFRTSCDAIIRAVGTGSKRATVQALADIMTDSLEQVPVETGTLISSFFAGVAGRTDIKSEKYGIVIGYGENNALAGQLGLTSLSDDASPDWIAEPTNPTNPKSGLPASAYAAIVHEDLDMPHRNGGNAKFLENAIVRYSGRFQRTAVRYWQTVLETCEDFSLGNAYINSETGKIYKSINWMRNYFERQKYQRIAVRVPFKRTVWKPTVTRQGHITSSGFTEKPIGDTK